MKALRQGNLGEVGVSSQRVKCFVSQVKSWVEQDIKPAIVVLAARRGVIFIYEAFGCLGPEPDSSALQKDTIFPLASLTKPIIATIAMILVEEGHLGLNRPVSFYIPEFTGEGKDMVIVHHLLTHTSGLRDEDVFTKDDITIQSSSVNTTEHPYINDLLHLGYNSPLHNIPGGEMSYCNYGYVLLGEIMQRVSGKPLSVFAKEKLFGPLGMKDYR